MSQMLIRGTTVQNQFQQQHQSWNFAVDTRLVPEN